MSKELKQRITKVAGALGGIQTAIAYAPIFNDLLKLFQDLMEFLDRKIEEEKDGLQEEKED